MSRVIWKFPIDLVATTTISVPKYALIRLVALDPATGKPAIWVELDQDEEFVPRRFSIHATGQTIAAPDMLHVGSVIDGLFVRHIFELRGS